MDLFSYIKRGVSPYHVVATSKNWLSQAGFEELKLGEVWNVKKGGNYYVAPYASSIYAFHVGGEMFRMVTGHTDQPMLKLKPNPTMDKEGNLMVNVESYGGMILHTWFDRPLCLAGKVILKSKDVFHPEVRLYDSKDPIAVIPSLAIHMDREVNKKNELKCQTHLLPLCGLTELCEQVKDGALGTSGEKSKDNYEKQDLMLIFIAEQLGVPCSDILDYDCYFYNPVAPELVGLHKELVVAPRLDNLTSCYSATKGLVTYVNAHGGQDGSNSDHECTAVMALFDHEEIGSRSKQGADSTLFSQILDKLLTSMKKAGIVAQDGLDTLVDHGFVVSMDVAHAYHPNYASKSDPTTKTKLGGGVVLKTSGSQRYHSDSVSAGVIMQLCEKANVRLQRQINHSDIAGGSTLGPIVASYLPIPGVDMGVGILAMHSSVETAAIADCEELDQFVNAFFRET